MAQPHVHHVHSPSSFHDEQWVHVDAYDKSERLDLVGDVQAFLEMNSLAPAQPARRIGLAKRSKTALQGICESTR
jgi:hypothetical protein